MGTWRLLLCVLGGLLWANSLHAQSVDLTEAPLEQRCVRNQLSMELDGKIMVKQNGKDLTYPHRAKAEHAFVERYLDTSGNIAVKTARFYSAAESTITFNNNSSATRSLRPERRFLVTQRIKGQIVSFSPNGALTREEMELSEHFDTMAVAGLLPGKTIEIGNSWPIPKNVVLALCELDGITEQKIDGKLESLKDHIAIATISGRVQGINLGAQVEMGIDARVEFDTKAKHIKQLSWKETDLRQQGPITPALSAEVTIKLTRTPIEEPEQLNKFALVKVPATEAPPSDLTNIHHQDPKKRFELSYARDWHVVSPEDSHQLVMRHIDRGDFIAQVTITPWKNTDLKQVMSLEKFAQEMSKTPGWVEDKEIERKELKTASKGQHTVYRVAATGELDGVRTVQYYYLVVSPQGEQLMVTFSVVPQHDQRLGARDLELVRAIVFPDEPAPR
jgi:hypothetical protein